MTSEEEAANLYSHMRAHSEVFQHARIEMMQNMSEQDLETFLAWLMSLGAVSDQQARTEVGFMAGQVDAMWSARKKVCLACGKNHDAQLRDLLGEPVAEPFESEEETRERLLEEFNVYDVSITGVPETGVRCKNCHKKWSSLLDRMTAVGNRDPHDCEGCSQKAKFG